MRKFTIALALLVSALTGTGLSNAATPQGLTVWGAPYGENVEHTDTVYPSDWNYAVWSDCTGGYDGDEGWRDAPTVYLGAQDDGPTRVWGDTNGSGRLDTDIECGA